MAGKIKTSIGLKVKPLPKPLLRAASAGEFVANLGGTDSEVRIAQIGFQRQLFNQVVVYGLDEYGHAQEQATYGVDGRVDDNELVAIDADDTLSTLERVDRGNAEAIRRTKIRYERLGLSPLVRFFYHDDIANDPDRRAHHNDELGVVDKQPVETADGYDLVTVARIRPGKDKGQYAEYAWGRRKH